MSLPRDSDVLFNFRHGSMCSGSSESSATLDSIYIRLIAEWLDRALGTLTSGLPRKYVGKFINENLRERSLLQVTGLFVQDRGPGILNTHTSIGSSECLIGERLSLPSEQVLQVSLASGLELEFFLKTPPRALSSYIIDPLVCRPFTLQQTETQTCQLEPEAGACVGLYFMNHAMETRATV
jgi:hypothetical protein